MARSFKQGYYKPKHPEKYIGNPNKIRFMSSWELDFNKFLDNNQRILAWSSENIHVPYLKPTTGKVHKYLVDYYVKYVTKHGELVEELIEIKPDKQTRAPTKQGKSRKTQVYEQVTYAVNIAKWKAAAKFAKDKGWKFRILTERSLFK